MMNSNATTIIQLLVSPVVMISACGLLCLAFNNRLASIVSRVRSFNQERLALLERIHASLVTANEATIRLLRDRKTATDHQVTHLLQRARYVRDVLFLLILCIVCMLACSITIGLSLQWSELARLALTFFVLGVVLMLIGMVFALLELLRSLEPITLDEEFFRSQHVPPSRSLTPEEG